MRLSPTRRERPRHCGGSAGRTRAEEQRRVGATAERDHAGGVADRNYFKRGEAGRAPGVTHWTELVASVAHVRVYLLDCGQVFPPWSHFSPTAFRFIVQVSAKTANFLNTICVCSQFPTNLPVEFSHVAYS